jgi:LPXTG-motif cell wall-anchored protein
VLAIAVAGGASLGPAAPAVAASGDASARGVVFNLNASVGGLAVVTANATIGTATAPPTRGTDTSTALAVTVPGAVGVTASGTVVQVTATRGATASSANANVANLALGVLGTQVLNATAATATVNCPRAGAQTANTTLAGLSLFGNSVTLAANTPSVSASAAVAVVGLAGAALNATLTRVETTSATGALAVALRATLTLTGTTAGQPVTISVGSLILAEATCKRPGAILPVTGSSTGVMLAVGAAMIIAGAVARIALRRRSEDSSSIH